MSFRTLMISGVIIILSASSCSTEPEQPQEAVVEEALPPVNMDVPVELVGADVISTSRGENFPSEDPIDGSLWFSVMTGGFNNQTIYRAARQDDSWETPQPVSFSGTWGDRAPRFSPDGKSLYFTSNRPIDSGGRGGDFNIWVTERGEDGIWDEPALVPPPVSTDKWEMHASITSDGTIYVPSNRSGTFGRLDIFQIAQTDGQLGEAVHLPAPINDDGGQPDLFVSPDGTWMILVITDHPDGFGGDDLYLSRFNNGTWTRPWNLGKAINSEEYEYGPALSIDGKYLYFNSMRSGEGDIYRVELSAIPGWPE